MEEKGKEMTLNKKVFYASCVILIICLFFTFSAFSDKRALEEIEEGLPGWTRLSVIDTWKKEKATTEFTIGTVLSLASGGVVYLIGSEKINLDEIIDNNKKKFKKGISKKMKQILEEE